MLAIPGHLQPRPHLPVDVDGLRVRTPNSQTLLDDLLYFGEVRLQGIVTEHFGKNLQRAKGRQCVMSHPLDVH